MANKKTSKVSARKAANPRGKSAPNSRSTRGKSAPLTGSKSDDSRNNKRESYPVDGAPFVAYQIK